MGREDSERKARRKREESGKRARGESKKRARREREGEESEGERQVKKGGKDGKHVVSHGIVDVCPILTAT